MCRVDEHKPKLRDPYAHSVFQSTRIFGRRPAWPADSSNRRPPARGHGWWKEPVVGSRPVNPARPTGRSARPALRGQAEVRDHPRPSPMKRIRRRPAKGSAQGVACSPTTTQRAGPRPSSVGGPTGNTSLRRLRDRRVAPSRYVLGHRCSSRERRASPKGATAHPRSRSNSASVDVVAGDPLDWLAAGTRLVVVVHSHSRTVTAYRSFRRHPDPAGGRHGGGGGRQPRCTAMLKCGSPAQAIMRSQMSR